MFLTRQSKPVRRPILHFKCEYDSATRYRHLLSPCAYCRAKAWRRVRFHLSGTYDPKPDPLPPATPGGRDDEVTAWRLRWPTFLSRSSRKSRGSKASTASDSRSDSEFETEAASECERSYELALRYNRGWREWLLDHREVDEALACDGPDALIVAPGHCGPASGTAAFEESKLALVSCESFQTACEMWEL